MFGVVATFMQKCVSVSGFKVNLGEHPLVGVTGGLKENRGIQKVNLLWVYCVLNLNRRVMVVEGVYEVLEGVGPMWPGSYNVI